MWCQSVLKFLKTHILKTTLLLPFLLGNIFLHTRGWTRTCGNITDRSNEVTANMWLFLQGAVLLIKRSHIHYSRLFSINATNSIVIIQSSLKCARRMSWKHVKPSNKQKHKAETIYSNKSAIWNWTECFPELTCGSSSKMNIKMICEDA